MGHQLESISQLVPYHIIDLYCHPNLSNKITWCVLDDNMGSDHFPIFVTVQSCLYSEILDNIYTMV